jgi:hypothetical protein
MTTATVSIKEEIERYLRTGDSDPLHTAWPGGFTERAQRAHDDLRNALVREVHRLAQGRSHPTSPAIDPILFTRNKVEPMVCGLVPRAEQDAVLAMLAKSVVFVTPETIEPLLRELPFDGSAWTLANLYLASCGAELLGDDAPNLDGLSENTTCYVSTTYFTDLDPFADVIVHEAAHVFHNCKRSTVGLRPTRTKEWLLDIKFRKRETFAYACEAYSRIREQAGNAKDRLALAEKFGRTIQIQDRRVDVAELTSLVEQAAAARNGWKVILSHCAPHKGDR